MDHKQTIEILEIIKRDYNTDITKQALDHAINCVGAIEQIKWERDIAIQQLHELGYDFGEKIREEDKYKTKRDDVVKITTVEEFDDFINSLKADKE